jgi:D-Tyr-tRNAtyr deacylase
MTKKTRSSDLTDGRFGAMMNVSLTNEVTLAHELRLLYII